MGGERKTNLYHCTNSDALTAILGSRHFLYSYCLEDHYVHKEGRFTLEGRAYAMVCFADLLEEELPDHMLQFGANSYIMMDKGWAKKNYISPVKYYFKRDLPITMFLSMIKNVETLYNGNETMALKFLDAMEIMAPFFKLYEGKYYLKGTNQLSNEPTEFFLEREWRSIPDTNAGEWRYLDEQSYVIESARKIAVQELKNRCVLDFGWNDVLKIGCKEEKKNEVLKIIHESFGIDGNEDEILKKIEVLPAKDIWFSN